MAIKHKIPAYHLRINKAVDRFLLIEALAQLPYVDRKQYRYYGLGGPFLEDFKLLEHYFPEIKKRSYECDDETYKRQKFNCFSRTIELVKGDMLEGLRETDGQDYPTVVWFDCTQADSKIFKDYADILSLVSNRSIVKLTMRVGRRMPEDYGRLESDLLNVINVSIDAHDKLKMEVRNQIKDALKKNVHDCIEDSFPFSRNMRDIRGLLPLDYECQLKQPQGPIRMLKCAVEKVIGQVFLPGCGRTFRLLDISYYSDGTTMLSVMGAVLDDDNERQFMENFKGTHFYGATWDKMNQIDLPALTVEERLKLNKVLPASEDCSAMLKRELGYDLEKDHNDSESEYGMYGKYYRYYPSFIRADF